MTKNKSYWNFTILLWIHGYIKIFHPKIISLLLIAELEIFRKYGLFTIETSGELSNCWDVHLKCLKFWSFTFYIHLKWTFPLKYSNIKVIKSESGDGNGTYLIRLQFLKSQRSIMFDVNLLFRFLLCWWYLGTVKSYTLQRIRLLY